MYEFQWNEYTNGYNIFIYQDFETETTLSLE